MPLSNLPLKAPLSVLLAVATVLLFEWIRRNHSPVGRLASVTDERLALLVWALSIAIVISAPAAYSFSAASRHVPGKWPLFEVTALGLAMVYVRVSDEPFGITLPLRGDEMFDLLYITSVLSFMTACPKLVRAASQRRWAKAGASLVVTLIAAIFAVTSSAMMLWFV
jgi:hypothetical protein